MDVFDFHDGVIQDYARYVRSFVNIRDGRIDEKVAAELSGGRLWPNPLVQFNPAYAEGEPVDSLCRDGVLHPAMADVFAGFTLYRHQVEALRHGTAGRNFVVTSGTGSGKSLTYLGTIFDYVVRHRPGKGVLAVIVYPMNALINSQHGEIEKYKTAYEERTGSPFPVRFAQYTGQEDQDTRRQIREEEPHVLLTNYMMLELIMTRQRERALRSSIQDHLRFLVYDELHTYRGRQGADVGMLNRRIHEATRHDVGCIGTSATMSSGTGTFDEQRQQVAEVARLVFGSDFSADQVVDESLTTQFMQAGGDERVALATAIRSVAGVGIDSSGSGDRDYRSEDDPSEDALLRNPVACWLEREIGLKERDGRLVRRKPLTMDEITERLAKASGVEKSQCKSYLQRLLGWVVAANIQREARNRNHGGREKPLLPFKLHQFIAQTGSVYVTLEDRATRQITLDAGYYVKEGHDAAEKPIFPVAFSRLSGHDFICVERDDAEGQFRPREFFDLPSGDDESDDGAISSGYVVLDIGDEPVWDESTDLENLPDSWLNRGQDGSVNSVKKSHRGKLPERVYFDESGAFADVQSEFYPYAGWYLPVKLPLDPTTGIVYDARTSEYTKLATLGSEARSTSTSVLARTVVGRLRGSFGGDGDPSSGSGVEGVRSSVPFCEDAGANAEANGASPRSAPETGPAPDGAPGGRISDAAAKLLSFTDNRQDASLQAGHFNDFNQVVQLRSAIFHAAREAAGGRLAASALARSIAEQLDLPEEVYAANPVASSNPFRFRTSDNAEALKHMLFYRAVYDLRRSWRVVLPNLEACGLLRVRYRDLDDIAGQDDAWQNVPGFAEMTPPERARLLELILDYFRTSYAIDDAMLERTTMEDNQNKIRSRLKAPWGLDRDEKLSEPYWMRVSPFVSRRGLRTSSVGYLSQLGRHLRGDPYLAPHLGSKEAYNAFVERLLDLFAGTFFATDKAASGGETVKLYRLILDAIEWEAADGTRPYRDVVRTRGYKEMPEPTVNDYFRGVYRQPSHVGRALLGAEHTGQIRNEERKERERDFREGRIQALFCSPTMELGIDIADLSVVHMRNVPPSPANYAQRSGRAGRSGQAALVLTYCANGSPHDRHYFVHSRDMVAGVVAPPRIDLANEELLLTHLHAVYLAEVGLAELDGQAGVSGSVADLVDLHKPPSLPLRPEVAEKFSLSAEAQERVGRRFQSILGTLGVRVRGSWLTDDWVERAVAGTPAAFDRALGRWRTLYLSALDQRDRARAVIDDPALKGKSDERRNAERDHQQALRQIDLLRNQARGSRYHSEFYPYRYLAAEGFLPGYNFTRLPVRAFIPQGDDGEYISRPRSIALREFGPRNSIYHNGSKYEVNRLQVVDVESKLEQAKVSLRSGYFMRGDGYAATNCPITGLPLSTDADRALYPRLLELGEVRTYPRENITCEEEERSRMGFKVRTYFALDGPPQDVVALDLMREGEALLTLKYIPTARLYHVNEGWSYYREKGFLIETKTGKWRKTPTSVPTGADAADNPVEQVQLFTSDVADALYIHPSSSLDLDADGVLTLQYALEKAVVQVFGAEQGEVLSTLMGGESEEGDGLPNVMIYEAAEGSLGILSQVVEAPERFREVVEAAWRLCYFDDAEADAAKPKASYDDLLSYYNQRHHDALDRHAIRDALALLRASTPVVRPRSGDSYDEHYQRLLREADPNSTLETRFLKALYERRLRLPDRAQWRAPDLYVQPDFFYEPNVVVFVDGSVHDDPEVRDRDGTLRRKLKGGGYRVVTWYYKDPFERVLDQAPDVFTSVTG